MLRKEFNMESLHREMRAWRQHLHQYPETAFEEYSTSEFISDILKINKLTVHEGLASTGIVATLKAGSSNRSIAIRADIDALDIQEENDLAYKSKNTGKMHACGHDGHSSMLLGAAKYLAGTKNFDGTVYFIFQPAEELKGGGKTMIEDGLFKLFPADSVYAMHNIPDIPTGHFALKPGTMMASMDNFEISLKGKGGHAAIHDPGGDLISAAADIITKIKTSVRDNPDNANGAILSFTTINGGYSWNIFPSEIIIRGTLRCFENELRNIIVNDIINNTVGQVANPLGILFKIKYNPESPGYPVTFNSGEETLLAERAAIETVGKEKVNTNPDPFPASEDFGFMLQEKPGCYILIGNGPSGNKGKLHTSNYDFNDEILPVGAEFWINIVESTLKKQ